jgi:hypothetical protein
MRIILPLKWNCANKLSASSGKKWSQFTLGKRVNVLKEEEMLKELSVPAVIKEHAKMLIKLCFI